MSAPPQSQGDVIADKAQLVEYLEAGCNPADAWRIGTEHEKFCYGLDDFRPLPYAGERSIRALLEGLQRFGWAAVTEGDNVIALAKNGAGVSLEPGGPRSEAHQSELQSLMRISYAVFCLKKKLT